MARIPYFDPSSASDRLMNALAGRRKINIFRMIANAENCAPEVLALGQRLSRESSLDAVHREIVILRVAHHTNARYQWHEHTAVAQRIGLTTDQITAVAQYPSESDLPLFTDFERTLLSFTDAVVATTTAPAELLEAIHAEYGDSMLVELVLLIGFYMMVGRVMNTFELELEDGPVDTYRLTLE